MWSCTPRIPALRRWRREELKFKVIFIYIASLASLDYMRRCFREKTKLLRGEGGAEERRRRERKKEEGKTKSPQQVSLCTRGGQLLPLILPCALEWREAVSPASTQDRDTNKAQV